MDLKKELKLSLKSISIKKEQKFKSSKLKIPKRKASNNKILLKKETCSYERNNIFELDTMPSSGDDCVFESIKVQHFESIYECARTEGANTVDVQSFMNRFFNQGILRDDPRIKNLIKKVEELDQNILSKKQFF